MNKGIFLTFEGGEGTGKSTQIRLLAEYLKEKGKDVVTTREPGGTPEAEEIRPLIVKGFVEKWDTMTETLLILAARRNHVEKLIKPSLQEGKWVLCDRFRDSSWVYQGWAGGLGIDIIEKLHYLALGDFYPDITLVLDLPLEEGLKRAHQRHTSENRFEEKGILFHKKLYEGYEALLKYFPDRCHKVSALGSKEDVLKRIISTLHSVKNISF